VGNYSEALIANRKGVNKQQDLPHMLMFNL